MVKGWDRFSAHFAGYGDQFVLIGGTAADLAMADAGLEFRATKDFDIVLVIEALTPAFVERFWEFIAAGGYATQQSAEAQRPKRYRFVRPAVDDFPQMLELFSRRPEGISLPPGVHITPIPDDGSSLSAILLDETYYQFVLEGRRWTTEGIPWVGHDRLIPLKASAWLNLTRDKAEGKPVRDVDVRKHAQDVRLLSQLLREDERVPMPERVHGELMDFLEAGLADMRATAAADDVATAVARLRTAFVRQS